MPSPTSLRLTSTIAFLRSSEAALVMFAVALTVQMFHAAEVFHRFNTSTGWLAIPAVSWILSIAFAAGVELAILLLVIRGREAWSWAFAGMSFATNLIYYNVAQIVAQQEYATLPPVFLLSAILPIAIALYSGEAAHATQPQKRKPAQPQSAPKKRKPAQRKSSKRKPTPAQRRAQIAEQELSSVDAIMQAFAVSKRTAENDLAAVRNGSRELTE